MTKVKLKDATKELATGAGAVLNDATRVRKSADALMQSLRKLEVKFTREEEERVAREKREEQEKLLSSHSKAFTMPDDDEPQAQPAPQADAPAKEQPQAVQPAPEAPKPEAPKAEAKPEPKPEAPKPEAKPAEEKPAKPYIGQRMPQPAPQPARPVVGQRMPQPAPRHGRTAHEPPQGA